MHSTLHNDYHGTSISLNLANGDITDSQVSRVRKLCPQKGYCPCWRRYLLYYTAFLDLTERVERRAYDQQTKRRKDGTKNQRLTRSCPTQK